ncbi:hypothetical protein BDY21DRAFT_353470 [Lineolata rhizophorae]|uniref:Uncharacterized protein n=1 Tax=Lineolata rhizophorae TaxID=578093 RepID=A0A6A6NRD1_9PEZI|nr:hypothetical protein BDY21DRAFT_353470 [Lineolata rhizophorae]
MRRYLVAVATPTGWLAGWLVGRQAGRLGGVGETRRGAKNSRWGGQNRYEWTRQVR